MVQHLYLNDIYLNNKKRIRLIVMCSGSNKTMLLLLMVTPHDKIT